MSVYEKAIAFCKKYPCGVYWWRVRKHADIVERHLNPGEFVKYAFVGQKNNNFFDFFSTSVIALTNKRIIIGRKRVFFGYFLTVITPDLFNDLSVYSGIIWGKVEIDTIKEEVFLTNLDKRSLAEIETNVTEFMMEEKKKYKVKDHEK
ncbi:MAG: PH domain-containing protein [Bacilli bacterium]|nr:PH domain-containing protein [Bacilli bacterium]